MNSKCIYYVEGPCEQQLITALKEQPAKLIPGKIQIIYLAQVLRLEEELVRCTDVKTVVELTKSNSVKNFKTDFCKMKKKECRVMLERHKLDLNKLWTTKRPTEFSFVEINGDKVKI